MGNIINANTRRIGYNKLWNSNWYSTKIKEYSNLTRSDFVTYWFVKKWINFINTKLSLPSSNIKLNRNKDNFNIILFLTIKEIFSIFKSLRSYLLQKYKIRRFGASREKKIHLTYKKPKCFWKNKKKQSKFTHKQKRPVLKKYKKKKWLKTRRKDQVNNNKNFLKKRRPVRWDYYWMETYGFMLGVMNQQDRNFIGKYFFRNKIKYYNKMKNSRLVKFLIKKQIIKFHKTIKIIFLIFQHYWLNPLLFQLKKHLSYSIKHFFTNKINENTNIFFILQNPQKINAKSISNFLKQQLVSGNTMYKAFKQLIKFIKKQIKKKLLLGIKFSLSGRLQRRGRAKYFWKKIRKIRNGKNEAWLDYDFSIYKSRFSLCGIKVWVLLNRFKKKNNILYYM